jgi:hypothetical protein
VPPLCCDDKNAVSDLNILARNYVASFRFVSQGSKGIGIPVIDPESIADFGSYLSGYLWQSGSIGSFSEAKKVQTVLPGIAMLANHHPYLANSKLQLWHGHLWTGLSSSAYHNALSIDILSLPRATSFRKRAFTRPPIESIHRSHGWKQHLISRS